MTSSNEPYASESDFWVKNLKSEITRQCDLSQVTIQGFVSAPRQNMLLIIYRIIDRKVCSQIYKCNWNYKL